jgi:phenylacetate-CoA ligase
LPREFRWVELYGLTETGGPAVAVGVDPAVPELAVNTDAFLVEVLDPHADAAVPFGEVGELTITTRMLDGRTPLIRYRTRDLVRATGGDSSTASRISRILGRVDDSLKVGGVLVYHTAVAEIVTDVLATDAEWRAVLVRHGFDDELQIEAEAGAEACRAVEQAFEERVGLAVTAVSVPEGQLARSRWKTQRVFVESEMPEPGG